MSSEKDLTPPGKVQEILVKKFTDIEVNYLTAWFYLSAIGLGLILIGLYAALLASQFLVGSAIIVLGLAFSFFSAEILRHGLHREHDLAVEAGNVGPHA